MLVIVLAGDVATEKGWAPSSTVHLKVKKNKVIGILKQAIKPFISCSLGLNCTRGIMWYNFIRKETFYKCAIGLHICNPLLYRTVIWFYTGSIGQWPGKVQ